jgi:2-polyprenyl-3-methyl-5-hydroxy-6-metoxy-1,4-benzoquinol methylase
MNALTDDDSSAPTNERGGPEDLVGTLFRAVLRREPDASGRATYSRLLTEGRSEVELLTLLMKSREYSSKRLVPLTELAPKKFDEYDPATDPSIAEFVNLALVNATREIRMPSVDLKHFERVANDSVAETGDMAASQVEYLRTHRERFYEINCIISNLLQRLDHNISIMDFGLSVNSFIMRRLFPAVRLSVADRPAIRLPANKFHQTFVIDLLDDQLDSIDLNAKFDIIVFSEVLEHVLVHPTNVIKFLLKHLTPSGHIILTTPNLFSRGKLQLMSQRRTPLPPYPAIYKRVDAPHFHVREYCMGEMLSMIDEAGGNIEGFFFSGCWDSPTIREVTPSHELSNMCFIFCKRETSVPTRRSGDPPIQVERSMVQKSFSSGRLGRNV